MGEEELAASLSGLAGLLTDQEPLEQTLARIAQLAVDAIPGAEGAGLVVVEEDRANTVVASADFVRAVEDVQHRLGEGPCLLAVQSRRTQVSGSLGGEARWPRFGPRVGRMGVHSALALPLLLGDQVVGAVDVYARTKHAFDQDAVRIGESFAGPATVSVHNAGVLAASQRLAAQMHQAQLHRAVIDQALGILRSRTGASEAEAFDRLRSMSQSQHRKLAEVAQALVDEAVRRARARRPAEGRDPGTP